MEVVLLTDLVQRNNVLKAGTKVVLSKKQAKALINANRAEKTKKVKEEKTPKGTKEEKQKLKTK